MIRHNLGHSKSGLDVCLDLNLKTERYFKAVSTQGNNCCQQGKKWQQCEATLYVQGSSRSFDVAQELLLGLEVLVHLGSETLDNS